MKYISKVSPALIKEAEKVIASLKLRRDEDIEEWARRLAAEVCNAND